MSIFSAITLPLIIGGALSLGIIDNKHRHKTFKEEIKLEETLTGVPLSVNHATYGQGILDVDIIINTEDNKKILAQPYINYGISNTSGNELTAIIESEINDGDNEPIELRGVYKFNTFKFWYLKANGFIKKNSEYDK